MFFIWVLILHQATQWLVCYTAVFSVVTQRSSPEHPHPDPEIRGGAGLKKHFRPFGPLGLKIRGAGPPGPSHGSATSTVVQKVDRSILWINSTQSQFFRHWRWRDSSSTGWLQHLAQHIWRNCVAKKRDSTQYWFVSKQKRLLKIWYPRLWRHCNPCWWHEAVDERPQYDVVQTAGITPAFN